MSNSLDRNDRKTREGIVVSNKMDKTIVVKLEEQYTHSLYGKVVNRSVKFKEHDEKNEAGIGERVLLMETRPLSATNRWRMVSIIENAK